MLESGSIGLTFRPTIRAWVHSDAEGKADKASDKGRGKCTDGKPG
jgi:hypothetical protein